MVSKYTVSLLGALPLWFLLASECTADGDSNAKPVDAFKVFANVDYGTAIRDVNTDPMFKCLTARRTELDLDAPRATYEWSLYDGEGKPRKHTSQHFIPGNSPDQAVLVEDSDTSHPTIARFLYADEAHTCTITEMHYFGYQCTLWTFEHAKDNVSPECLQKHKELCGEGVALYHKDTCN